MLKERNLEGYSGGL